tara:strand:- start:301 stop:2274 length:1974 start_codon:yes stop_codon:yes gene_type:complete
VANYNVDIEVGVKGAQRLTKFRKEINRTAKEVDGLNQQIRRAAGNKFENSIDRLNASVSKTSKLLNRAAVGTRDFEKAARLVVKAEKERDMVLQKTEKTLARIRLQESAETLTHREKLRLIKLVGAEKVKDLKVVQETLKTEQQRQRTLQASRGMGLGKRLQGGVGSAIIGGGFPLLFGQGPAAAVGGGIGGLAGGLMGGQMGFALSIAGTTIGGALDDLAKALAKPTENIEKLVTKLGLVDTPTGKLALELEKLGLTSSAAALLIEEFEKQFGLSQGQIKENAEKMTQFNNEINQLGTEITLLMANSLGPFMAGIIDFARRLNREKVIENLQIQLADQIRATGGDKKHIDNTIAMVKKAANKKRKEENLSFGEFQIVSANMYRNLLGIDTEAFSFKPGNATAGQGSGTPGSMTDLAKKTFTQREIVPLQQAQEIERNRLTMSSDKLNIMKEQHELDNLNAELALAVLENEKLSTDETLKKIEKIKEQVNLQEIVLDNAKALVDPFRQISNIIAQDIGDGIKGLIRGTETLGGLLNNVLNKMADAFLNLGLFGNIGGTFSPGAGLLGRIFKAEGGPVKAGGSYIVGERGPEMFSPGVSGTITPNHALGGSTTVVVNVDASGSSVEGDEQGARELGRLISVAVQSEIVQQKRPGGLLA